MKIALELNITLLRVLIFIALAIGSALFGHYVMEATRPWRDALAVFVAERSFWA